MTFLFASITRFRDVPHANPKTQYVLGTGFGGGDGMDFAIGTEVFEWNSDSVPSGVKPKRIITLWIDATNLTAGKNLIVKSKTQQVVIPGGQQDYVVFTVSAPFTITISTNGGTGVVNVTAYDFNAIYTGTSSGSTAGASSGGGSGGTGGGGYSGGTNYGGGGGGKTVL